MASTTLSNEEQSIVSELQRKILSNRRGDIRMDRYYEGRQRLDVIGLAVPPELSGLETIVNWSRVVVDEPERRMNVRYFVRPGEDKADEELQEASDANNLDSELPLLHRELLTLGRAYASVSTNPDDKNMPLITVESAREIAVTVDPRSRKITAALRLYRTPGSFMMFDRGTLYLPDSTIWLEGSSSGWKITDRDDHNLGRVPLVMYLHRRRVGKWHGESEMTDVIPIVDAAARAMTDLQLAVETHAVPTRYVLGISKGDFVDKDGNPLPVWEAYYDRFMATAGKKTDVEIGQLPQTSLDNFHDTVEFYGNMAASVSGLPSRYFGQNPANPAAEGAIIADESRLIMNVNRVNSQAGAGHSQLMALWLRFKTGEWVDGNRVATEWFDPRTPTFAQRADALQKLAGGQALISREGVWDELGWSEARKKREREYFESQESDLMIERALRPVGGSSDSGELPPTV